MHVESVSENQYTIYINNQYFASLDCNNKEEITKNVKQLVIKLNQIYRLNLSGFYKMNLYLNKRIGMMIELYKLEDFGIEIKTIDLRITIYLNSEIWVMVKDWEIIKESAQIYYYDGYYYSDIANFKDEKLLEITEWGNFIYGDEIKKVKQNGKKLKQTKKDSDISFLELS